MIARKTYMVRQAFLLFSEVPETDKFLRNIFLTRSLTSLFVLLELSLFYHINQSKALLQHMYMLFRVCPFREILTNKILLSEMVLEKRRSKDEYF